MTQSFTGINSDTYSESRANYVIGKVYENTLNLMATGLITKLRADTIRKEILYLLSKKALKWFELQFRKPDGSQLGGIHYELKADGSIYTDEPSGGLDFWGLPANTIVKLLVNLDDSSPNINEVNLQIAAWGWGTGNALQGAMEHHKSFSKEGFGLQQSLYKW
jgi:hypothetical protein